LRIAAAVSDSGYNITAQQLMVESGKAKANCGVARTESWKLRADKRSDLETLDTTARVPPLGLQPARLPPQALLIGPRTLIPPRTSGTRWQRFHLCAQSIWRKRI